MTGLAVPGLLRASHINPWADCETDGERLDVFNGLLLAPNLDVLFDGGWMTMDAGGAIILSARLDDEARARLGLADAKRCEGLTSRHQAYMAWHRSQVFGG